MNPSLLIYPVHPPLPFGNHVQRPECAPPRTDLQDGRTGSPRRTVRDYPSWASGAAPPAGSLRRCSQATSSLALKDTGLGL